MENYLLIRNSKPPMVLATFDCRFSACQHQKFMNDKMGEGRYLTLPESEARKAFPNLHNLQHKEKYNGTSNQSQTYVTDS